jgi:hypothetical protein
MTSTTRMRRRAVWMLATVVLLLALALSACAGRGAQTTTSSGSGPATTQSAGGGGNSGSADFNAAVNQVSSLDAQIQGSLGALDDAQSAANQDLSSQDNETQP